MKAMNFKRWLSLLLCVVLIAAMALFATGCNKDTEKETSEVGEVTVLGEGTTAFTFTVTDLEGKETAFEIHTDKKTVGEALMEHELIAGDEGEYGLYVKTVNGITIDYETDGKYWAFYVNGEYGMAGVDATNVEAGVTYSFKAE